VRLEKYFRYDRKYAVRQAPRNLPTKKKNHDMFTQGDLFPIKVFTTFLWLQAAENNCEKSASIIKSANNYINCTQTWSSANFMHF